MDIKNKNIATEIVAIFFYIYEYNESCDTRIKHINHTQTTQKSIILLGKEVMNGKDTDGRRFGSVKGSSF